MKIDKIKLNFFRSFHLFYDWLNTDNIKEWKNVVLVRVRSDVISDIIHNDVKLIDTDLKNYQVLLFTDTYTYVALHFKKDGSSFERSSLLLNDEMKLENKVDDLKLVSFKYEIINTVPTTCELRGNEQIKKVLKNEITKLEKENNIDKLTYFYYEWFKKESLSKEKMLESMYEQLSQPISEEEKRMYFLVKNNYKMV